MNPRRAQNIKPNIEIVPETELSLASEKAVILQKEIDKLETAISSIDIPEIPVGADSRNQNSEKFVAVRDAAILRTEKKQVELIGLQLSADIEPNILSQYENTAYNLRFFMAIENANHDTIADEEIIVIAETGSTGFNITDLTIHSIIAPGPINKNTTSDVLSFTIVEPHGNRLFDQMRNGAMALGIVDHLKTPLWFEVSFKGYSPPGGESHQGGIAGEKADGFENLNDFQFLYKIKIGDVKVEIDAGGTSYKFQTVPFDQGVGFEDAARRLESNETIIAGTIGEYFTRLTDTLNNTENYKLKNVLEKNFRIRKYAFAFAKEYKDMLSWEIKSSSENKTENKRWSQITKTADGNSHQIRFNSGTPIEAIVQEVIGATEKGQALAIFGDKNADPTLAGDPGIEHTRKADNPIEIFMVEPIVDVLGYNPLSNLYNVLITYHIRPYKSFKTLTSREEIKKFKFTESRTRLQSLINIANVKKAYDYIFTGLNTEVLDYKIEFNQSWFISLPLFRGQNRDGVASQGSKTGKAHVAAQIVQEKASDSGTNRSNTPIKKRSNQTLINDQEQIRAELLDGMGGASARSLNRELRKVNKESRLRANAIAAVANIDINTQGIDTSIFGANSNIIRLNSDIRNRNEFSLFNQARDNNEITFIGGNDARNKVNKIREDKALTDGSIFFVEDILGNSVARPISDNTQRELYMLSNDLSATQAAYLGNIEGTISKGRPFFTSIMNQMYGSKGEMVNLDLSIRGDPYWLGETDPRSRLVASSDSKIDLTASDVYILMTFDFPRRFGDGGFNTQADSHEGTGLVDLERGENGFNGIYLITEVTSEFSNGKFTQKLAGVIDAVTNEQDFISLIIGTRI